MKTYARERQDLLNDKMAIPVEFKDGTSTFVALDEWTEGKQDDLQLGLFYTDRGTFNTIDLDFKNLVEQRTQYAMLRSIQELGFNIVNCGHCGHVFIHGIEQEELQCPYCDVVSEPSDNGDFFTQNDTVAEHEAERSKLKEDA